VGLIDRDPLTPLKKLNEQTVQQAGKAPSSFELPQAQTQGRETGDSITNYALPNEQGRLI
jgi:hypothetical protein